MLGYLTWDGTVKVWNVLYKIMLTIYECTDPFSIDIMIFHAYQFLYYLNNNCVQI